VVWSLLTFSTGKECSLREEMEVEVGFECGADGGVKDPLLLALSYETGPGVE
jgi:hypothetical protein